MPQTQIDYLPIADIHPRDDNPRSHSKAQIKKIAASIRSFGFRYPVLIDGEGNLISGHGRLAAAKTLGLATVPTMRADDLTPDQVRALMIADNRIGDLSDWDDDLLANHLDLLVMADLDFEIEDIGFNYGEIEVRLDGSKVKNKSEKPPKEPVLLTITQRAQTGDLWQLGEHRVDCGDALDAASFGALMGAHAAAVVFTDPPYNLKPAEISPLARTKHGAFDMGSDELTKPEFTQFLGTCFDHIKAHSKIGATAFVCMDWRHVGELQTAGEGSFEALRNNCIWVKDRPGMGSLYRSQHELVFVWQVSAGQTENNVQLGSSGRSRSNVWEYPPALGFRAEHGELQYAVHYPPTVKPVAMIAVALMDVSRKGGIVLDPFLGSGSSVMAAQQTDRRCFGIEISLDYVDLILARWEAETGQVAECLNRFESSEPTTHEGTEPVAPGTSQRNSDADADADADADLEPSPQKEGYDDV